MDTTFNSHNVQYEINMEQAASLHISDSGKKIVFRHKLIQRAIYTAVEMYKR